MSREQTPSRTATGRPAALLAVRACPADAGRRVTVRHRLDDGRLTDVVGTLRSWDAEGVLRVVRRTGEEVAVRAADVVAATVVAPEIGAEALQRVAEAGWPPLETARLGDWELRASHGVTGRANSVRVDGDPGLPLDAALAQVSAWYADRGLPPSLQVPTPSVWDDALDARGWSVARRTLMRTAATAAVAAATAGAGEGWDVVRTPDPSPAFLAFVEPSLPADGLARILRTPQDRVHVEVRADDGRLVATGRASAAPSRVGRWAGVTSIHVAEDARRRGLATVVMGELARWSLEQDCRLTYLQALATNDAAAALYDGLGFVTHHAYVYRSPAPMSPR